jgi:spore coat protein U-like protein
MIQSSAVNVKRALQAVVLAAGCSIPSLASAVTCSVSTQSANFGIYNPLLSAPASTTGSVDVACTCSVVDCVAFGYRLEVSAGRSGNVADRTMRAGGSNLHYNLYTDANYSSVWGSGSAGMSVLYLVALFGSKQTTIVYARAPASQNIVAGSYSDTPMVTITY